ncbi:peroxiredoxin-like family protein (plasmid) [Coraliomargarita sp. W4R53]
MSQPPEVSYELCVDDHPSREFVGTAFPDAELLDVNSRDVTFGQVTAGRPAVVVFYRGAWCPYCNLALRQYHAELAQPLAARGVALIAISPQRPDGSTAADGEQLAFEVLSDAGNTIARQLGLVAPQSEERTAWRLSRGVDLAQMNGDGTTDLVHPTVAVVDADGILRWIDVHVDYQTRTPASAVLAAVAPLA